MLLPLADEFFGHPLIASLSRPGKRPSYVPAKLFSSAVLDLLARHEDASPPVQHVKAGLAALNKTTSARPTIIQRMRRRSKNGSTMRWTACQAGTNATK